MKSLLLFCLIAFVCSNASGQENIEQTDLTGTWKYFESVYGRGDGTFWARPEPRMLNKIIIFKKNKKIAGTYLKNARYNLISNGRLEVIFPRKVIFSRKYTAKYSFHISQDTLNIEMEPICDEGCGMRFIKVKE